MTSPGGFNSVSQDSMSHSKLRKTVETQDRVYQLEESDWGDEAN